MRFFKITAIAILASGLLFGVEAKHRDVLYMSDGSEHVGELVKIAEDTVVFQTEEQRLELKTAEVRSVDLGTWRPGDDWKSRFDIDDAILEEALERADEASRKYRTAGYITLYEKGTLTVEADGTAEFVERYIYYIANESGKDRANWSTTYFEDAHSVDVDFARAIGVSHISTVADNAIEDGSTNPYLADYQRHRAKKFALTGASLGSVVDYQISKKYKKLDIFNGLAISWRFYDTEAKLVSIFEVAQKGDTKLSIEGFKAPKPKSSKREGYSVTTWAMSDIEPFIEETMLPDLDRVFPNLTVSIPADLTALSAAYFSKIQEATDARDALRARLVEQFPDGKPTLEGVYNFVSENFTSNRVGMSNYYPYPKPLSQLLTSSRMARHELVFLLYCFLSEAGIPADLVLLGPSLDSPTPLSAMNITHFQNIAVRVDDGGVMRYLEPNEFLRYDHQSLGGLWALPVAGSGAKAYQIPRVPGNYAYSIPRFDCVLSPDGALDVKYTIQYFGPNGGDGFRYRKNDKQRELDNHFERLAKGIDEMANLVEYKLTGFKSLSEKVEVEYSVHIPGFAVGAGDEILAFKLPTVAFGSSQVGAAKRTLPFSLAGEYYGEKIVTIELPEGYEIEHLPKSVSLSANSRSFMGSIELDGRRIVYRQVSENKHAPLVSPKEYSKFKQFIEGRSKFAENWILLRKSS